MSKKAENEKKSITKSLKLSPDIASKIDAEAKQKGMNFSQYMIDCAIHKDNALTPEIMCRIENVIEMCVRIADENNNELLRMEADKLWEYLK